MKSILFLIAFLISSLQAKHLQVDVSAKSAVLMNGETGAVLYEKNPHAPSYPASITKVATALYAMEVKHADLSRVVKVSAESVRMKTAQRDPSKTPAYWLESDGTRLGLLRGEEISLESLLHALMLQSANDAANVIAESMSGSIPSFVSELNEYLKSIGCLNTHFCNPHGLHHPEHQTSAYDMCLIAKNAMHIPKFREIVAKLSYVKPKTNLHPEEKLRQFNHLLRQGRFFYPKAIGIKTGYTSHAQNTLVAAALDGDRTLIAVVMGCENRENRYVDVKKLFEAAFHEQKIHQTMFKADSSYSRAVAGATSPLTAALEHELAIDYYPAEEPDHPKAEIRWTIPALPIHAGQKVGELRLIDAHGTLLNSTALLAREEVQGSWTFMIKDWWSRLFR
ncbi:MAG: Peptidase protein [Parachlamydiales bacterium]|nr:Peptidase protein [Parachlamydiales bacterium]